jgi:hypothetical protein
MAGVLCMSEKSLGLALGKGFHIPSIAGKAEFSFE